MDYAGGSIVHAQGGVAALVAVYFLGPRVGRFNDKGNPVGLHSVEVSVFDLPDTPVRSP